MGWECPFCSLSTIYLPFVRFSVLSCLAQVFILFFCCSSILGQLGFLHFVPLAIFRTNFLIHLGPGFIVSMSVMFIEVVTGGGGKGDEY